MKRQVSRVQRTCEQEAVDVLAIVAEGHLLLSQSDRVFSSADSVKGLEVCFVDAPQREIDVDGI